MKSSIKISLCTILITLSSFGRAQQQCFGMLDMINKFITETKEAKAKIQTKNYTEADAKKLERSFAIYDEYYVNISSYGEYMQKCLQVKMYAAYASVLYTNRQYKDLENLSEKAFTIVDDIRFQGDPPCVVCVTRGNVEINEEDEETGKTSKRTAYTTTGVFEFTENMFKNSASLLFEQIAFAAQRNGNKALRNKFFLKEFDEYYFTEVQSNLANRLAHDILNDFDEANDKADNVIFAAATVYLMQHKEETVKGGGIVSSDKATYQKAIELLKKNDFVFSSYKTKNEILSLNKKITRYYFFAAKNMAIDNTTEAENELVILKQLISSYKKSDEIGIGYNNIPQIFPRDDRAKAENLTNAIIKDNDRVFMTDLANILYHYYNQYDYYIYQNMIRYIAAFYKAAGKNSKAEKVSKLLH